MKTLQQHIAESKALHQNVNIYEKLIINKDSKFRGPNDLFCDEFKEELDKDSDLGWYDATISHILPIEMPKEWREKIIDFFGDETMYIRYAMPTNRRETKLYEDMLAYIENKNNDVKLSYENTTKYGNAEYIIYLIESKDFKVGLYGYRYVDSAHFGTMTFQYK